MLHESSENRPFRVILKLKSEPASGICLLYEVLRRTNTKIREFHARGTFSLTFSSSFEARV